MKLHELKLLDNYAIAKKQGIKPFEIRKNDRNFQVGDLVKYNIIEKDSETNEIRASCDSELCEYFDNRVFKIKYISDYEQKSGYVVFSEEEYYIGDKQKGFGLGIGGMLGAM